MKAQTLWAIHKHRLQSVLWYDPSLKQRFCNFSLVRRTLTRSSLRLALLPWQPSIIATSWHTQIYTQWNRGVEMIFPPKYLIVCSCSKILAKPLVTLAMSFCSWRVKIKLSKLEFDWKLHAHLDFQKVSSLQPANWFTVFLLCCFKRSVWLFISGGPKR